MVILLFVVVLIELNCSWKNYWYFASCSYAEVVLIHDWSINVIDTGKKCLVFSSASIYCRIINMIWIRLYYNALLFYGFVFINCHASTLAFHCIMGLDVKICVKYKGITWICSLGMCLKQINKLSYLKCSLSFQNTLLKQIIHFH